MIVDTFPFEVRHLFKNEYFFKFIRLTEIIVIYFKKTFEFFNLEQTLESYATAHFVTFFCSTYRYRMLWSYYPKTFQSRSIKY